MYVEVIGSPDPSALREAIRDAMKESGNFAPGPGSVHQHLRAVLRTRPGDPQTPANPDALALPPPDTEADQRVLRELSKRIAARSAKRRGELLAIAEHLRIVEDVERELRADLDRLTAAQREGR